VDICQCFYNVTYNKSDIVNVTPSWYVNYLIFPWRCTPPTRKIHVFPIFWKIPDDSGKRGHHNEDRDFLSVLVLWWKTKKL